MMVKLTAPAGKKLRDTRNNTLHTEVITDERKARFFVVADSADDPTVQILDGETVTDKVAALEDELAAAKILLGVE